MKKKAYDKLKEKSVGDLTKEVEKLRVEIANSYAKRAVGKETNLKAVAHARIDIAQILTLIGQKTKDTAHAKTQK